MSDNIGHTKSADGDSNGPSKSKAPEVEVRTVDPMAPEIAQSKFVDVSNVEEYDRLFKTDEDAVQQPTTTRLELWSYYLYVQSQIITFDTCINEWTRL